jgi:hypothetical protein
MLFNATFNNISVIPWRQLYWWRKPEYPEKTTDLTQVTDKRGLNQILKRQTSRFHYGSKVPAVTITVFKYRNNIGKIVVKAVLYSVK